MYAAYGADGAVEHARALPPAVLVALVVAVVWWRAVTRTAVGVARGRAHSWLVFWALWILGWTIVFASSATASVLAPTIGWLVPSVLQVLVVGALVVVARHVAD